MKKTIDWTKETAPQILGCCVYEKNRTYEGEITFVGSVEGMDSDGFWIHHRDSEEPSSGTRYKHGYKDVKKYWYKSRTGELLPMGQAIEIEKKWDGDAMIRAQIDGWWPVGAGEIASYACYETWSGDTRPLIKPNQGPRSSWETMTIEQATEKYGSEV